MSGRAVVGVANHNGWANLVSMGTSDDAPVVIDRRRVELVDQSLPKQPYHHEALELPIAEAQDLVERVRRSAGDHARACLATLRAELEPGHTLIAIALRQTPFGVLPADVTEVLNYRPFIYAADTMLYLEVLAEAAEALGLAVVLHEKGQEFALAGSALGLDPLEAEAWIKDLGAPLGPPWSKEHQQAAAAAIAVLGEGSLAAP